MKAFPALGTSFHLIALDVLGHGYSDMPREPFNLPGSACFITRFLDSLGIEAASLGGSCMGGIISLETALLYPEGVKKLVLADSAGLGKEMEGVLRFASVSALSELFRGTSLK